MLNFYSYYNKKGLEHYKYQKPIKQWLAGMRTVRIKQIKHILKNNPYDAYAYTYDIMKKQRWFEVEPMIMKNPRCAYSYAEHIIGGRWFDAEPYIMADPYLACEYAEHIIKGRWFDAEPTIERVDWIWYKYCGIFGVPHPNIGPAVFLGCGTPV